MVEFGDHIARLPAVKYAIDNYPHIIFHLWTPNYFVDIAKNLLPDAIIKPFYKGNREYNSNYAGIKTDNLQCTPLRTHLVNNAFQMIVDKEVKIEHKNYLKLNLDIIKIGKFTLPEKYVIVPVGHTVSVREFHPNTVNHLIDYILNKGYTPVFLGNMASNLGVRGGENEVLKANFNTTINYNKGLNLINKTSLLETGKIIAGAKCIVGVDSGLHHVAGCTDTAIVCGYTTVKPEYRLPIRNNELGWNCYSVVPNESLDCKFCQSEMNFIFEHDFRQCYYVAKGYDTKIQCVEQLTADKFIKQLDKIL